MNGVAGLVGWRWLFILEGISSCLLAVVVFFLLPDYPESAMWLSAEEKALAADRMRSCGDKAMTWKDAKASLMDWRLYAHYLVILDPTTLEEFHNLLTKSIIKLYFLISAPFSNLSLFIPAIVAGLGYTSLNAQLMNIPPYAVAYVVTLLVAWSADRFNS